MSVEILLALGSVIGGAVLLQKKKQVAPPAPSPDADTATQLGAQLEGAPLGGMLAGVETGSPAADAVLAGDYEAAVGMVIEDPYQALFGVDKEAERAEAAAAESTYTGKIGVGIADEEIWNFIDTHQDFVPPATPTLRSTLGIPAFWVAFNTSLFNKYGPGRDATNKMSHLALEAVRKRYAIVRGVYTQARGV